MSVEAGYYRRFTCDGDGAKAEGKNGDLPKGWILVGAAHACSEECEQLLLGFGPELTPVTPPPKLD